MFENTIANAGCVYLKIARERESVCATSFTYLNVNNSRKSFLLSLVVGPNRKSIFTSVCYRLRFSFLSFSLLPPIKQKRRTKKIKEKDIKWNTNNNKFSILGSLFYFIKS